MNSHAGHFDPILKKNKKNQKNVWVLIELIGQ
jgi:hypothetical protein